jgi:hypothetical protein
MKAFFTPGKRVLVPGPYYPLGTIGTVPRVYEGMEGRKIQIKK